MFMYRRIDHTGTNSHTLSRVQRYRHPDAHYNQQGVGALTLSDHLHWRASKVIMFRKHIANLAMLAFFDPIRGA